MSARQAERRFVRFVVFPVLQGGLSPFRGLDAPRAQNQLYVLACGEVNGQLAIYPHCADSAMAASQIVPKISAVDK